MFDPLFSLSLLRLQSSSSVDEKKLMDRERNRRQARKSRKLKKQCADKMEQQLNELEKESVRRRESQRFCVAWKQEALSVLGMQLLPPRGLIRF